jgi:uncharacterized repeat protein (TIGR04076 family)
MKAEKITIEIFEGKGGDLKIEEGKIIYPNLEREGICAWMYRGDGERSYQQGEIFNYPKDMGKLCPWLLDSMQGFIRVMEYGGTLGWKYAGTPYEKEIDEDGITTEFVRCPDPTASGIVVKITKSYEE